MIINWKKIFILLLCLTLVMGMAACTKKVVDTPTSGIYKAGTYTATAKGHNGDVKVEVVFDANAIVSVKVLEHKESASISDAPIERIPGQIVEKQTLAIDTVSGATFTSNAILTAVEDCVKQAGGNVDKLKLAVATEDGDKDEIEMTTDIVVIGGGGTGLAAAASAHENGADVILLEKLATVGGSTALSGGGISATGTRFQKELGIEDTKESWMSLWKERQATSNPNGKYPDYDRVDTFMDEAIITTSWLVDYIKHSYSKIEGFGFDPVRRLHFAEKGGSEITNNIEKFIIAEGVKILTETTATELLVDGNGNVIGVIAEGIDGKITINAKKVIIATGGFARSEELLKRLAPQMAGTSELTAASVGSTGDGIIMAEKLGAALYEEQWVIGLGMSSRIPELAGLEWDSTKVLVNEKGERFMNESSHYAIVTNKVSEQDQVWMILDSSEGSSRHAEILKGKLPSEEIASGETIGELAISMGVTEDALVKTMSTFNEGCKTGTDVLGKPKELLVSVDTGPYYAVKYYPKTMGTFGGVKTDDLYRVLRDDGSIINNLYAGGEASNKILYNQVYMSGSAVQLALTSGRIAGEHAAKAIK